MQCIQNDAVVNFNYGVIRIAHCSLNIESTQAVHILIHVFKRKRENYNAILSCGLKDARLERFRFK